MRVNQAQSTASAHAGKSARRAGASGGTFEPARGTSARKASPARGPALVSSLDAILALQTVDDNGERRRKAMQQGHDVLDNLDELKIAVLSGRVTAEKLTRLQALVQQYEDIDADPNLSDVLRQIDLRAQVELAKFQQKNKR